jgi:LAGLIDADG DNA endonuclease family protein
MYYIIEMKKKSSKPKVYYLLISLKLNRGYYTQSNNDKIEYYNPLLNNFYLENKLGPNLAGLIEGDRHIYVPSTIRGTKGKKIVPSIEIAFNIKDYPLFEKIKDTLEGGYIVLRKNNKSGRLIIKKKSVLLKLINLINGYMRTPKIEALHRLID